MIAPCTCEHEDHFSGTSHDYAEVRPIAMRTLSYDVCVECVNGSAHNDGWNFHN